ncbi:MAG: 2-oxoglutarate dehydrogenase E1 component [Candidatus Schekmanbacteria bacterium]|nr:2-oxoglutarate dehydrogenase E1 component [Candidatus Schekmanbacteria bacterium]
MNTDSLPTSHCLAFVEAMYEQYARDPSAVEPEWQRYFRQLGLAEGDRLLVSGRPDFSAPSLFGGRAGAAVERGAQVLDIEQIAVRQDRVDQLIRAYRVRGHTMAHLDPLGPPRALHPELELAFYDLGVADLDTLFSSRTISGTRVLTLRQILERLRNTYCGSIGVQFMHIDDMAKKFWLQNRMEDTENRRSLTRQEQLRIFTKLVDAEVFEQFIARKYPGSKRFSLEGAESLIPLLDLALEEAGETGVEEAVIGMAHRGRLNVLGNIILKDASVIFREFEDLDPERLVGRGDVKYHLGHSSDVVTSTGKTLHLSLCFNPSHLEFVSPVVLGRVRAKQDRRQDTDHRKVLSLLIHGDAAFIAEGVVQEILNLSDLPGYTAGGTIHIIVNNQIGFTTPPESARSSQYCTDIAKMLQIPIFHVNGEDPEAVAQVIKLAIDFRETFRTDVVIDMYCYRRHGHNEGDEPSFTQPTLYTAIRNRKTVVNGYLDNLLKLGGVTREEADEISVRRRARLEEALSEARERGFEYGYSSGKGLWEGFRGGPDRSVPDIATGVPRERLTRVLERLADVPESFNLHPKLRRFVASRQEMARGERPLDWSAAEAAALGTLLLDGVPVRLSGQDSGRGTFSHRHAVFFDFVTGRPFVPLAHLDAAQGRAGIWDSPLSEAGVLGFEYGYSLDWPDALVLWEAQFGDFANAAQVIIDQFISSSEDKWGRLSGIVLLLPHGFEGQGPEHSSARLERFLMLSGEDNIQVTNPTTPAQLFHLLRRQVHRKIRKPLIVLTPKSLLRHPEVVSEIEAFTTGTFRRLIPDQSDLDPGRIERIVLCSGKLYYELDERRKQARVGNAAVIRIEQLYPFPLGLLQDVLLAYPAETPVVWAQEEPVNMGAWPFLRLNFGDRLLGRFPLTVVGRARSASPATGSARSHALEQARVIEQALGLADAKGAATAATAIVR